MSVLQATWLPDSQLFFWCADDDLEAVAGEELPQLEGLGRPEHLWLLAPGGRSPELRRVRQRGLVLSLLDAVRLLAPLDRRTPLSPSVRVWSAASKLALELAARQRVVPSITQPAGQPPQAHWRALLTHQTDASRFDHLAEVLPPAGRCAPLAEQGRLRPRWPTARASVRGFIDGAIDEIYRQGRHGGPSRGWVRELAEGLRSTTSEFSPRDARFQGIPDMLRAWSDEAEAAGLRLRLRLVLPPPSKSPRFPVQLRVFTTLRPQLDVGVQEAWTAGPSLALGGAVWPHPAQVTLRNLARAARIFEPLAASLQGAEPVEPTLDVQQVYQLLESGAASLRESGIDIQLPEAFTGPGKQRVRARMRIQSMTRPDGTVDLDRVLDFRWEVTLGEHLLDGRAFAELVADKHPIVWYKDQWVLLDPEEMAKLPPGLPQAGQLPASEALRAVLVGEHNGVPVVADDRLQVVLDTLRQPPDVAPPEGLKATLRPYQLRGLAWLSTLGKVGLGACLADDMGLGKTVQLIAHLLRRKELGSTLPSLIVCPTSVLGNWDREFRRFAPHLKVYRHHGDDRDHRVLGQVDAVLTTYGLMIRDQEQLRKQGWDLLVLDEAQNIKNPDSHRARAARSIKARHRVALSGTPVENRLDELWSIMEFLIPSLLGNRSTFQRNVAVPIERFGDEQKAAALKEGIAPFLLRRLKKDSSILSDLPEKMEQQVYVPLTKEQARLYQAVVESRLEALQEQTEGSRNTHILAMLTQLKQVCNHPDQYLKGQGPLSGRSGKLERTEELMDNVVAAGEAAILFTQFYEMGVRLQRHFSERLRRPIDFLHGGTPIEKREQMVASFQDARRGAPLLIVSLKAGGTGLNLTRASHVIHYDRWWNPAVEDQATDRAYRIGQQNRVQVHKLVAQGTLEERIAALLEKKRELAESVVGVGEQWLGDLSESDLRNLVALGEDAVMDGGT